MKIAVYLDDVSNAIDNAMQRNIMKKITDEISKNNELVVIDPVQIGESNAKRKLQDQQYDILFTYNKTGTDIQIPGKESNENDYLLSKIEKIHVCWLTEHPVTFYDQYLQSQNKRHYIFPNEGHSEFASKMGLEGSFSTSLFGAHPTIGIKKHTNREFDICIAAQWRGPAMANAIWKNSDKKTQQFFMDVLALEEVDENRDIFKAYMVAAEYHKIKTDDKKHTARLMRATYWYSRKQERINLVRDLVSMGLKILLIGGDAWRSIIPDATNVTYSPPCDHQTTIELYKRAKGIVCTNGFNGASERVFDALSTGGMVISENASSIKEILTDNKSAIFYKPNKLLEIKDSLIDKIKTNKSNSIGQEGTSIFLDGHTWQHRGKFLNGIFDTLNLGQLKMNTGEVFCSENEVA